MKKLILTLLLSLTFLLTACELPVNSSQQSNSAAGNSSIGKEDSDIGSASDDGEKDFSENGSGDEEGNGSAENSSSGSSSDGEGDSAGDEGHTDTNQDDVCDDCKQPVAVTFDIFSVNDLHGKLEDGDNHPGVDELSTYLKEAKAKNENTILLSAGDMWQGTAESYLTKGNIITDWMNEMGFAAMTLGNHEYDWGEEAIEDNAELAEFPFLAINVYDVYTNRLVDYCQPSVMIEQSGVKIGVIGAMGDCYSSISADKVEDVEFKTGSALTTLVRAEATSLREQGADCIIYSIHDGASSDRSLADYYNVTLSDYVDVVFEAHTHEQYITKDSYGVYHLQAGGDNKGISHAELKINFVNEAVTVNKAEFVSTSVYKNLEDDPVVDDLMEKYDEQVSIASKLLGKNDQKRYSSEICQTVADLYYQAGVEKWGDQYDIVLGGGYLKTRSPYDLPYGYVYYGDLLGLLPFDNPLVLCSIKGRYLQSRFFDLPNNYYIGYDSYGASVKNNIDASETYYVVVDRYTSLYSWNHLTEIEVYDETTFARDLLAEYIAEGEWGEGAPSTPSGPTTPSVALTDIPTLISIAEALGDNEVTAAKYYVQGTIKTIHHTTYGNMTIQDADGNQLYIFGTQDANGTRYDGMANQPQVGDTVILYGAMMKYVPSSGTVTIEMYNGVFYDV